MYRSNRSLKPSFVSARGTLWQLVAIAVTAVSAQSADLEFAHGLYQQKQYKLAAEEYERFLKQSPTGRDADVAVFFLAESLGFLNREADAVPLYDRLVNANDRASPYYKMALYRAGELRYHRGDFRNAAPLLKCFADEYASDPLSANSGYYLGESLLAAGDTAGARLAFEQAVRGKPSEELRQRVQLGMAKLAERQGNLDEAENRYRVLSEGSSSFAEQSLLALGALYYERKSYDKALEAFRQLIQKFPKGALAATARLNEGLCLYQLNKHDEAAKAFRAIIDSPADSPESRLAPEAWYRLGWCYLGKKDYSAASAAFRDGAKRNPKSPQAVEMAFQAAWCDFEAGKHRDAETAFATFVEQNPGHEFNDRALYYAGRSARERRDLPAALGYYQKLKKDHAASPWFDQLAVSVAELLATDAGNHDRESLLASLRSDTDDPAARAWLDYYLAGRLFEEKKYAEATAILQPLLANPKVPEVVGNAQYLLGVSLASLGRNQEAIAPLAAFLFPPAGGATVKPGDIPAAAIVQLGSALTKTDRTPDNDRIMERVVNLAARRPDSADLFLVLAEQQYEAKRYSVAIQLYEHWLTLKPAEKDKVRALVGLGWSHWESDQPEPAYGRFREAAELAKRQESVPPNLAAEAWAMTGFAARRLQKTKEATNALQIVLDRYPASDYRWEAGLTLARLQAEQQQYEAADRTYVTLGAKNLTPDQSARILYERGWLALDAKKPADAEKRFKEIVDRHPASEHAAEAILKLAELTYDRQAFAEAEKYTLALEAKKPDVAWQPAMYYRRGLAIKQQGRSEDARRAFAELVQRFPKDKLAAAGKLWMAEIDFEHDNFESALRSFQELASAEGADAYRPTARLRVAQCRLKAKEWDAAYRDAERFLADNKDPRLKAEALYVQGQVLQSQAKFAEAREKYLSVITDERSELAGKAQFMIGETLFHQQKYEDAVKEFWKVVILYQYPEWQALALLEIGQCQERLKQPEAAADAYRKILDQYGATRPASQAKTRLAGLRY